MNSSSGAPALPLSTQPLCALFVVPIPGTVSAVGCLSPVRLLGAGRAMRTEFCLFCSPPSPRASLGAKAGAGGSELVQDFLPPTQGDQKHTVPSLLTPPLGTTGH